MLCCTDVGDAEIVTPEHWGYALTMNVWTAPLPNLGHQTDAAAGTWVPGADLTVAGIARPS